MTDQAATVQQVLQENEQLRRRLEEAEEAVDSLRQLAEQIPAAEEQLRQHREKLEEEVQSRTSHIQEMERQRIEGETLIATGRMAATIAHEINNPLAGIRTAFWLIKDCVPASHPHFKYVALIDKEIQRIAHIVRQMVNLYRPEQEAPREFSANDVVHDITALTEPTCRIRGVQIREDLFASPLVVTMPELAVRQVLFNLVQNAIEASPAGGVVTVTTAATEEGLAVTVADQGGGIPESMRPRVFEPFFTTKRETGWAGLGLGLTFSRDLVHAMGGTLTFEVLPDQGTIFAVKLPFRSPAQGDAGWSSPPTS